MLECSRLANGVEIWAALQLRGNSWLGEANFLSDKPDAATIFNQITITLGREMLDRGQYPLKDLKPVFISKGPQDIQG